MATICCHIGQQMLRMLLQLLLQQQEVRSADFAFTGPGGVLAEASRYR